MSPMLSPVDRAIGHFDRALRTLAAEPRSVRPVPGAAQAEVSLSKADQRRVVGFMRVNHTGEVCAQALYQGQAMTAREVDARDVLRHAADEETEHLAWTLRRIRELGGRPSLLNPLWYGGALAIGVTAGLAGDKWSLGFLAETERQVGAHLQGHLEKLPEVDGRSREILTQMHQDETGHAQMAEGLGAAPLPKPVRALMRAASKVMTGLAYYI
jgi:ubiquinone biosynthesis monooxygenase Coq7